MVISPWVRIHNSNGRSHTLEDERVNSKCPADVECRRSVRHEAPFPGSIFFGALPAGTSPEGCGLFAGVRTAT